MREFCELSTAFHVLPGRIFPGSINTLLAETFSADFKRDATACQNQVMGACLRRYNMQERDFEISLKSFGVFVSQI